VGFPCWKEAHRPWSAGISSAAVPGPVQTVDDIDEMRSVMSMAGEAEPRGILHLLNLDGGGFELSENMARLLGVMSSQRNVGRVPRRTHGPGR
jgi:hypothetical protein